MSRQAAVAEIAARVPAELRSLRGKLMLEGLCETLGVEETYCPACEGSGLLNGDAGAHCPLCLGFLEVPDRLADWFKNQLLAARARSDGHRPGGAVYQPAVAPLDRAPEDPSLTELSERLGRLAEETYHAHLPLGE